MKQRRKLGEACVGESAGCAVHGQHPALAALGGRLLRNQLRRQVEIKVGNTLAVHDPAFPKYA